jgi:hypothetical protein
VPHLISKTILDYLAQSLDAFFFNGLKVSLGVKKMTDYGMFTDAGNALVSQTNFYI